MTYRLQHVAEYAALRVVTAACACLPPRPALVFGAGLAALAWAGAQGRIVEAGRRIRAVFGPRFTPRDVRRIAWTSWRNMVFNGVEMARVTRMTRAWLMEVTDGAEAVATLQAHAATGRGAIIAIPHMGNWELAAMTGRFSGLPLFSIAAAQKNPLVNAYINRLRETHGVDSIARGSGAIKAVIRRLRAGGILAILPDVRVRGEALPVPFLGGTANLGKGMAVFARHADVPIFPCVATRRGWSRHALRLHPPVFPDKVLDKADDIDRMTRSVMRIVEDAIRAEPGQWFWFNRRWVLDPVSTADSAGEHHDSDQ